LIHAENQAGQDAADFFADARESMGETIMDQNQQVVVLEKE
jgi:hypothetical protein